MLSHYVCVCVCLFFFYFVSLIFFLPFLVADTQLYKRLCPFIGRSVGWSVGWSIGQSVGRSVTLELKSGKTRISAPAHRSATGGRVSGLVTLNQSGLTLVCLSVRLPVFDSKLEFMTIFLSVFVFVCLCRFFCLCLFDCPCLFDCLCLSV